MDATGSVRWSAFSTLAATLIAPEEAFAAIRERPQWGWAIAVTIVLAAAGSWLGTPALRHMIATSYMAQLASDPRIASLPPERAAAEMQKLVGAAVGFANFTWLFSIVVVPIVILVEAAILFSVGSVVGSTAGFAQLFSLAAHVQFIAMGIGSIVLGAVVALHSPDAYRTQSDFISSIPTAAWLVPNAPARLTTFLSTISPFSIWATVILALGLTAVSAFRRGTAWITASALLFAGASWAAAFAR
jgi:hypothetical protein